MDSCDCRAAGPALRRARIITPLSQLLRFHPELILALSLSFRLSAEWRDWRGILSNRKPNVISREILMLIIVMVAGLIYSVVSRRRRERRAREDLKDKHD